MDKKTHILIIKNLKIIKEVCHSYDEKIGIDRVIDIVNDLPRKHE